MKTMLKYDIFEQIKVNKITFSTQMDTFLEIKCEWVMQQLKLQMFRIVVGCMETTEYLLHVDCQI